MNNHQTSGKNQNDQIAVCIMPWAGLREEIQVGSVRFWPWDENRVSDPAVREQLNRYFNCFVDHYGKRVETITICSHGEPDFRVLSNLDEYNEICSAVDILIFSAICPQTKIGVCSNNQSVGPPTADRYQLIGQKMKPPNEKSIVIGAGSLTNCDQMDKVRISKPWCVGGSFGTHPDEEFISAFDKVFSKGFSSNIRERIFRSLAFFRIAHTEADLGLNQPVGTASLSKLVMMATAFEILLEFPESPKSKYFAEQIENRIKTDEFLMEERIIPKNKPMQLSKGGWWAWDFYKLRNRIVHGDNIEPEELKYKEWITYNIVADLVFWEFIKRELYEQGCLGDRVRKWTKEFEPVTDAAPDVIEDIFAQWILGFEDVHRALGWIPPLRTSR
jgi:hypothetical protein